MRSHRPAIVRCATCMLPVLAALSPLAARGQAALSVDDAARAIAAIAAAPDYSDHKILARELRLPDLPGRMVWR